MRDPSDFDADPEWYDEYDPEHMEELFQTFKSLGMMPADIKTDAKYAELYAEWLKAHADDE